MCVLLLDIEHITTTFYRKEVKILVKSRVTEVQASEFYSSKIKLYSNGNYEEIRYLKDVRRIKKGYEPDAAKSCGRKSSNSSLLKEIRKDSLSRTRNLLIEYACENEFKWLSFITLTFKKNEKDISKANYIFNSWVTRVKRVFPDFVYLGVPEFQKRGAVHYHLLTNLSLDSDLIIKQENTDNMYDVKFWSYGFSSVFDLSLADEKFNIALYICKYLYKDVDNRLFGRNKILKSNNLLRPDIFYLSKYSDCYNFALSYIKEKEYSYTDKLVISQEKYSIPFIIYKSKIDYEDTSILKSYLHEYDSK